MKLQPISRLEESKVQHGQSSTDIHLNSHSDRVLLNPHFRADPHREHSIQPQNIFDDLWRMFQEIVRKTDKGERFSRSFQHFQIMKSLRGLWRKNGQLAKKINHDFLMSKTQDERQILARLLLIKQLLVELAMRVSTGHYMRLRDDEFYANRVLPPASAQLHIETLSGETGKLRSEIANALQTVSLFLEQQRFLDMPEALLALWDSVWEEADGGDIDFQIFYVESLYDDLPRANNEFCNVLKKSCDGMTELGICFPTEREHELWLWRSTVCRYQTIFSKHPALPRLLRALTRFDAVDTHFETRTDETFTIPWERTLLLGGFHSELIGIGMLANIPAVQLQIKRGADESFDSYVKNIAYAVACTDMECAWLTVIGKLPNRGLVEKWAAELSATADQPEHRMLAFLHLEVIQAKRFVYKAIYGHDLLDEDWNLSGILLLASWPGLQQEVVLKEDNLRIYRLLLPFLRNHS